MTIKITIQPPSIFTNQQGGKRHGFDVAVQTKMQYEDLFLSAELVYADNFSPVLDKVIKGKKRKLLMVLDRTTTSNDCDEMIVSDRGVSIRSLNVRVRINDVSRNHTNRKFRLKLAAVSLSNKVRSAPIYTKEIKVISKHPKSKRCCPTPIKRKKKRARVTPVPQSVPGTMVEGNIVGTSCGCTGPGNDQVHSGHFSNETEQQVHSNLFRITPSLGSLPLTDGVMATDGCLNLNSAGAAPSRVSWNERAFCMLKSLSSQVIGLGGSHKQCPSCLAIASIGSDLKHRDGCLLHRLLEDFDRAEPVLDDRSVDADVTDVTSDDDDGDDLDFYLDGVSESELLNYEIDLAE